MEIDLNCLSGSQATIHEWYADHKRLNKLEKLLRCDYRLGLELDGGVEITEVGWYEDCMGTRGKGGDLRQALDSVDEQRLDKIINSYLQEKSR